MRTIWTIMISTVTQLNISETSNSIDGTDGDWSIVSGEKYLYVVNNKDGKKYKISLGEEVSWVECWLWKSLAL